MSDQRQPDDDGARDVLQRSAIAELRGRDERLDALRARRADAEVERIAAEVALRAARSGPGSEIDASDADAVVRALDRLRWLESESGMHDAYLAAGARSHEDLLERIEAGDAALAAWLDAGRDHGALRARRIANTVLLVACAAVLVLAVTVHVAFLVLLIPFGGATSFLLWTGQDAAWRRLGAQRRFDALRLRTPDVWSADAVRARRRELGRIAERVRERAMTPPDDDTEVDGERLRADFDAARGDLDAALQSAGLPSGALDEAIEATLRATARARRAEGALASANADMAAERESADVVRESLYRDLAHEGEAPRDGDASTDALESAIEKVTRR